VQVSIFCELGLKKPIHARPQIGIFGGIDLLNGEWQQRDTKRHIFAWKHVIWHIDRQNQSAGGDAARSQE